jgi:bacterioferritin (cytochrome b1)
VSRHDRSSPSSGSDPSAVKRILLLEDGPNVSDYDRSVSDGQRARFDNDLALEMVALEVIRRGVRLCLEGATTPRERCSRKP